MKIPLELVNFLKDHAQNIGHSLIKRSRKLNLSDELFEKVLVGDIRSEEEAADLFYGVWDHRYRELRGRFIDALTTSLLMIDFKGKDLPVHSKEHYRLMREVLAAKILQGQTQQKSAIFFAERCYKRGKELHLYDIVRDAIIILKNYYGTKAIKAKEYDAYYKEWRAVENILKQEQHAHHLYASMLLHYKKNSHRVVECIEKYQAYVNQLIPFLSCPSLRFQLFTRLIRMNVFGIQYDFQGMLDCTNEDIDYFGSMNPVPNTYYFLSLLQKVGACQRLGMYEEALDTIRVAQRTVNDRSLNYFTLKYQSFFIRMQTGGYEQARTIYEQVIRHKRYKTFPAYLLEEWEVGGAYLRLIEEMGLLTARSKPTFKLAKFLNSVPEYSKDKRVKHVPIYIVHILFFLLRSKRGELIDRIDRIEQYCAKHLRYNEAIRSNAFIKALLEIPKRSFHAVAVERHAKKYLDKMKSVDPHENGKRLDLEIIPYETLWQYAMKLIS
ncbi:MAG: hypothetical protein AAF847_00175 [Bacteroidota bacterium]